MSEKEEKIGGTSARQEPGSERGGVRKQRRPEINAEAKGDVLKLQKKALSVAEFLGHDPEVWRLESVGNCGQIRCRTCGAVAGFALYPMRGKDTINGPAVETRC